ncbi:MAG TPA: hypothetical protein EYM81_05640 [Candidatus Poseidoniales archaeon]|nr:hypothetical protein [Candidatus Poseidoniales archaeon]HIN45245.1 hypothetical protein [Candidatus Poseidoniales archaeon]HIO87070.1 hypothetical protein [Candidatus Poseidoniales archaeon]
MIRARFGQIRCSLLVIVSITLLLFSGLSMNVNAEHEWDHTYTINGEVFQGDGSTASDVEVKIDCSVGKSEPSLCEENIGRSERTSMSGKFQLALHVHSTDHGLRLVLDIDGQSFNHTINLNGDDGQQTEEDRTVDAEFTLDHDVSKMGMYIIIALVGMTITVPFLYVIRNSKSSTNQPQVSRSSLKKKASTSVEMARCPKCDVKVKESNLESHLMKVHHQSESKAKELAESVKDE